MIRKIIAVVVFLLAAGINFFDELYKLRSLEWVPEILSPLLIVAALYIWGPSWLKKRGAD